MTRSFDYTVPPCPELYLRGSAQLLRNHVRLQKRRFYLIKSAQILILLACYTAIWHHHQAAFALLWECLPEDIYEQVRSHSRYIIALLLAMLFTSLLAQYIWAKCFYRRFYAQGLPALPSTFHADENSIRQQYADNLSDSFTGWAAVQYIEPLGNDVLLSLGSSLIVLPASIFANDEETQTFIQQARAWQQAAHDTPKAA